MPITNREVPQVVVNKLTQAQYDTATKNQDEFYLVTDAKVETADISNGAVTSAKIDWTTTAQSYLTTEVDTGATWIDGKPIYKKTFSFTLDNAGTTTVNHGISNFGTLIKYEGSAESSSTKFVPIPRTLADSTYQVGLEGVTTTSFEIDVGSNGPMGKQAYITLWYTKTTD